MKKIIYLNLIVLLFACKANPETKVANKAESAIKGDWHITSVKYPGSDMIKVKAFDIANTNCFEGSNWTFVPNNNTGTMALSNSACDAYQSKITFYINKEGNFIMKLIDEDLKAKKVTEGFVLKFTQVSETTFTLTDQINVGGKLTDVVYHFEKNN